MSIPTAALRVASWLLRAAPPILRAVRAKRAASDVEARKANLRREIRERNKMRRKAQRERWPL